MAIWHRIFGTLLMERCHNSRVEVLLELDTSQVRQLLDCMLIYAPSHVRHPMLPDGLEPLARYNLVSFKSHQDLVNDVTLRELMAHAIGFQKYQENVQKTAVKAVAIRLVAISARFPRALAKKLPFTELGPGIYDVKYGLTTIRLLVASRMSLVPENAPLLAVCGERRRVEYAGRVLQTESVVARDMVHRALKQYKMEGYDMPFTWEDAKRELHEWKMSQLTPEERMEILEAQGILRDLPPEERLKGLKPEERLKGLKPEERLKGLKPEERLKGLTQEELRRLAQQLNTLLSPPDPQN